MLRTNAFKTSTARNSTMHVPGLRHAIFLTSTRLWSQGQETTSHRSETHRHRCKQNCMRLNRAQLLARTALQPDLHRRHERPTEMLGPENRMAIATLNAARPSSTEDYLERPKRHFHCTLDRARPSCVLRRDVSWWYLLSGSTSTRLDCSAQRDCSKDSAYNSPYRSS